MARGGLRCSAAAAPPDCAGGAQLAAAAAAARQRAAPMATACAAVTITIAGLLRGGGPGMDACARRVQWWAVACKSVL